MKNVSELIESRISANAFDTSRRLSDEQIEELVRLATLAPSSFNAQNWKVIAVRTAEAKQRLKKLLMSSQKSPRRPLPLSSAERWPHTKACRMLCCHRLNKALSSVRFSTLGLPWPMGCTKAMKCFSVMKPFARHHCVQ